MRIYNGLSYQRYINSSKWETRRNQYFLTRPRKCVTCGTRKDIHLHHKTYARMGNEFDSDLAALCEFCHDTLHKWHTEVGGDLLSASNRFIRLLQEAQKHRLRRRGKDTFVPRNQRGTTTDEQGRKVRHLDWRDEVRSIRTDLGK